MKSGAEPEEEHICEIVSSTVLLTPATKLVLRPNELLILRLQNNRDRPRSLMLEVADFAVQLLTDMFQPSSEGQGKDFGVGR